MNIFKGFFLDGEYRDKKYVKVRVVQNDLSACKFHNVTFVGCVFVGNINDGVDLGDLHSCCFDQCDLTRCRIKGYCEGTVFTRCVMNGINFSARMFSCTRFQDSLLHEAVFHDASLKDCDFSCCELHSAMFNGASFVRVAMDNCTLDGTQLDHADLRGLTLCDTTLNASLDYAAWPLCCKTLNWKTNDATFYQLLYHVLAVGRLSDNPEIVKLCKGKRLLAAANKFHRVGECGRLT